MQFARTALVVLGFMLTTTHVSAAEDDLPVDDVDYEEEGFSPAEGLEDFVAVTTKITEPTRETPASVSVITAEQIRNAGFRSVGEALTSVPGLFVSYDLQNYNVAMRGVFGGVRGGSRFLKIMVDGEPVTFVQTGTYYLGPGFIPMNTIERIEILRGPSSALYGTGAYSGAVNVVTKRAPYEGETTINTNSTVYGGTLGQTAAGGELSLQLTGRSGSIMAAVGGGWADRSGLSVPQDSAFVADYQGQVSVNDIAKPRTALVRGDLHVGGGRLSGMFITSRQDVFAEFYDLSVLSHNTRISITQYTGGLTYEKPFASGLDLKLQVGLATGGPNDRNRVRLSEDSSETLKRSFGYVEYRAKGELRYEFKNGGFALAGLDISLDNEELNRVTRIDNQTGTAVVGSKPDPVQIYNVGFISQLIYPMAEWLKIAAAGRIDINQITGLAVSARLAAVIPFSDQTALKLILARSFRTPSPEQLYGVQLTPRDIQGIPSLKNQLQHGAEIVLETFPTTWLSLSATGFYNRLTDALTYVSLAGRSIATPFDGQSFGGELVVRSSNDIGAGIQLQPTFALTYQSTLTDEAIVGGQLEKDVPDNEAYPTLTMNAKLNLKIRPAYINLYVDYRFIGGRVPSQSNLQAQGTSDMRNPGYTLDPYSLVDISVSSLPIKIAGSEVVGTVRITNLLDSRYSEIGFNGIDVPAIGRTAWLNLSMSL